MEVAGSLSDDLSSSDDDEYDFSDLDSEIESNIAEGPEDEGYENEDHGPYRPNPPRLRKCRKCGTEFFEIAVSELCPSCGCKETFSP
jgi:rubrerythrin